MDTLFSRLRAVRSGTSRRLSSFLSGFTSAFNIRGDIDVPDWSRGPERDAEALRGDWYKVGSDLWRAMGRVTADEQQTTTKN